MVLGQRSYQESDRRLFIEPDTLPRQLQGYMQPHNECSNITFKQPAASTRLIQTAVKSAGEAVCFDTPLHSNARIQVRSNRK